MMKAPISSKTGYSSTRAAIVFLCLAAMSSGIGGYLFYVVGWEGRIAHLQTLGMTLGALCLMAALLPLGFAAAIFKRLWTVT